MAKKRSKPTKKYKSFSEMHGSKSPMQSVGGDQLGHDAQLPVNPVTGGASPLREPGNMPGIGMAMGNNPSGEEFY